MYYGKAITSLAVCHHSYPQCLIPGLNLILEIMLQLGRKLKAYLVQSVTQWKTLTTVTWISSIFLYTFNASRVTGLEKCPVCFLRVLINVFLLLDQEWPPPDFPSEVIYLPESQNKFYPSSLYDPFKQLRWLSSTPTTNLSIDELPLFSSKAYLACF